MSRVLLFIASVPLVFWLASVVNMEPPCQLQYPVIPYLVLNRATKQFLTATPQKPGCVAEAASDVQDAIIWLLKPGSTKNQLMTLVDGEWRCIIVSADHQVLLEPCDDPPLRPVLSLWMLAPTGDREDPSDVRRLQATSYDDDPNRTDWSTSFLSINNLGCVNTIRFTDRQVIDPEFKHLNSEWMLLHSFSVMTTRGIKLDNPYRQEKIDYYACQSGCQEDNKCRALTFEDPPGLGPTGNCSYHSAWHAISFANDSLAWFKPTEKQEATLQLFRDKTKKPWCIF